MKNYFVLISMSVFLPRRDVSIAVSTLQPAAADRCISFRHLALAVGRTLLIAMEA